MNLRFQGLGSFLGRQLQGPGNEHIQETVCHGIAVYGIFGMLPSSKQGLRDLRILVLVPNGATFLWPLRQDRCLPGHPATVYWERKAGNTEATKSEAAFHFLAILM